MKKTDLLKPEDIGRPVVVKVAGLEPRHGVLTAYKQNAKKGELLHLYVRTTHGSNLAEDHEPANVDFADLTQEKKPRRKHGRTKARRAASDDKD